MPLRVLIKKQEWPCSWHPCRGIHWDGQACGPDSCGVAPRVALKSRRVLFTGVAPHSPRLGLGGVFIGGI